MLPKSRVYQFAVSALLGIVAGGLLWYWIARFLLVVMAGLRDINVNLT